MTASAPSFFHWPEQPATSQKRGGATACRSSQYGGKSEECDDQCSHAAQPSWASCRHEILLIDQAQRGRQIADDGGRPRAVMQAERIVHVAVH